MISSFPVNRMTSFHLLSKPTSADLALEQTRKKRRVEPLFWAILFGLTILLGFLAEVDLEHARFFGLESPPCLVETILGSHKLCPGFGLTRSTALAIQGRWGLAWSLNPGGIPMVIILFGGVFLYISAWAKGCFSPKMLMVRKLGRALFLGAVFFPWYFRIFFQ